MSVVRDWNVLQAEPAVASGAESELAPAGWGF
jgi:hypothetical protein